VKWLELSFPRDVTEAAALAGLENLSGVAAAGGVTFMVAATKAGITHRIGVENGAAEAVATALRGGLPGLRVAPVEVDSPRWTLVERWRLGSRLGVLRTDNLEAIVSSLLATLQPLKGSEAIALSWTLYPGRGVLHLPERGGRELAWPAPAVPSPAHGLALREKAGHVTMPAVGQVAVRATSRRRAQTLAARPAAVLRSLRTPYGRLVRVRGIQRHLEEWGSHPRPPMGVRELLAVLGLPVGSPMVAGLRLGTSRYLMPAAVIPSKGTVVGTSNWPGLERRIAIGTLGAAGHAFVVGSTGTGKSTLLISQIRSHLEAGHGVAVLDGKGDLVAALANSIPPKRERAVAIIDRAEAGEPVAGINVLADDGREPELVAENVLHVFREVFQDSWGPRSDHWLRAGLVTLAQAGWTLADLPVLFQNEVVRARLVAKLTDPFLLGAWQSYAAMSVAGRAAVIAPAMNKAASIVGRTKLRAVLAQPTPRLSIPRLMDTGGALLVSLAPSVWGAPGGALLGAATLYELWRSIQSRVSQPLSRRRPFFIFIDEPAVLGRLAVPVDTMYEMARGMNVGITTAAQSPDQLLPNVRKAVLNNSATIICYRVASDDARTLARELAGVEPADLQGLGQYEVVARIGLGNGAIAPPVTAVTPPPPEGTGRAAEVRALSRQRYGQDPQVIETTLRQRSQSGAATGAVGRKRRAS
jgi:hypothetical protein